MTHSDVPLLLLLLGTSTIFNVVTAQGINITNNPENQTICVGMKAMVNCGYTGGFPGALPVLLVNTTSNLRDSPDIPGLPSVFILSLNDTTTNRIIIGPVSEQFIGMTNISCFYQEHLGSIFATPAVLAVIGPPGTPTITISEIGVDSFTLTWTVPQPDINKACGPVQYNVTVDDVTNTTTMSSVTYSELNHTTSYVIVVTPYNDAGSSPPASITVTTLTPSAPFPPTGVQLNRMFVDGNFSITVTWMAPQLAANMSQILHYRLMLTVNSTTMFNTTVAADITAVDIFMTFSDVSRAMFTDYSLSVAAVNSIGPSSFTEPMSIVSKYEYIQEVLVNETTVLCNVVQSQPPLICRAVLHCINNGSSSSSTLLLSNGVFQNYMTSRLCNVTMQVLSSDSSEVLEESVFYNVFLNSTIQPTPSASSLPTPDRDNNTSDDSDDNEAAIAGIVVGIVLVFTIAIALFFLLLLCYHRHRKMKNKPSTLNCSNPGNKSGNQVEVDQRDGSSSSQDDADSPGSTTPIIPSYNTVHVVTTDNHNNKMKMAVVSQYSQVENEDIHTSNGNTVNKTKATPQYTMVHKPTKAEGKVNNYTELATIGPYPSKRAPENSVQYTDVIPSNFKEPPQYSNMEQHQYANESTAFTHTHQQ